MEATDIATVLAWAVGIGRALTGAWFLAAPTAPARNWVDSAETDARYLVRSIGGRDLAIGAGIMWAAAADEAILPWLLASLAADLVDAGAGAAMLSGSPRKKSLMFALGFGAIGAAATAFVAAT